MTPRTLKVLEYDKILARVAERCAFSGGADMATALLPTDERETAQRWLGETAEAARLLEQKTEIGFGGVRDVRPLLAKGQRGSSLMPSELLETKNTLMRARSLRNLLLRLDRSFPRLAEIAEGIEPLDHVVNEIGRAINDRGEVVDSASAELARIRQQLRVAQERLLSTLDRLTQNSDIRPYLQDAIVTQRQGRYVIPVRAESKGQVNGIVHDQSASGATLFVEPLAVVQQNKRRARAGAGRREGSAPHSARADAERGRRSALRPADRRNSGPARFHLCQSQVRPRFGRHGPGDRALSEAAGDQCSVISKQ